MWLEACGLQLAACNNRDDVAPGIAAGRAALRPAAVVRQRAQGLAMPGIMAVAGRNEEIKE